MENLHTPPPTPPTLPMNPPVYDIPKRPKTWLVESILVTILCCSPFAIAGIYNAVRVNSLHDRTEYEKSQRASRNAKRWMVTGLLITIVYYIVVAIIMSASSFSSFNLPVIEPLYF